MTAQVSQLAGEQRAPPLVLDDGPGAYRWWYFDAVSADGATAIVVIFFVGSVFSPYYAGRLARGEMALPRDHIAVNVAIYRRGQRPLWAFSEYGEGRLQGSEARVVVAQSQFERRPDGSILIHLDERRTLSGRALRGHMTVTPMPTRLPVAGALKLAGERHQWRPIAPRARVVAHFAEPDLTFEGTGYHDENWGTEPPARAMTSWSWGRVHYPDRTRIFFDTLSRAGGRQIVVFDSVSGASVSWPKKREVRPHWGSWLLPVPKALDAGNADDGRPLQIGTMRLLERAPFYLRAVAPFDHPAGGRQALGVTEHVDFARFQHPVVRRMIALRVARPDLGDGGLLP